MRVHAGGAFVGPAPTLRSPLNLPLNHLMARTSPPRHSLGHSGVPPPLSLPPLSRLDCTESFLPTPSEQLIGLRHRHPLPWPCPACSDPRPSHRAVCRVGQLEYVRSAPTWVRRPPRAISNTLATTTRRAPLLGGSRCIGSGFRARIVRSTSSERADGPDVRSRSYSSGLPPKRPKWDLLVTPLSCIRKRRTIQPGGGFLRVASGVHGAMRRCGRGVNLVP